MTADLQIYGEQVLKKCVALLPEQRPEWRHDVRRALEYFRQHIFEEDFSVSVMKIECNISHSGFSLNFRKCTGFTPKGYMCHYRIEAAKRLLRSKKLKGLSIGQVGQLVGYERPPSFVSRFSDLTGLSPGRWRAEQHKTTRQLSLFKSSSTDASSSKMKQFSPRNLYG